MSDSEIKPKNELDPSRQADLQKRLRAFESRVRNMHAPYVNAMNALQLVLNSQLVTSRSLVPSPAHQLCIARMLSHVNGWSAGLKMCLNEISLPEQSQLCSLKPTQAYILDLWLGDEHKTFASAWDLVFHALPTRPLYLLDQVPISVLNKRYKDGEYARWRLVDFSDHPREIDANTSNPLFPGTELMWALVYNPMLLSDLYELYSIEYLSLAGVECEDPNVYLYLSFGLARKTSLGFLQKPLGSQPLLCSPRFADSAI